MLRRPESGDTLVGSVVAVAEQTASPWEHVGAVKPWQEAGPCEALILTPWAFLLHGPPPPANSFFFSSAWSYPSWQLREPPAMLCSIRSPPASQVGSDCWQGEEEALDPG